MSRSRGCLATGFGCLLQGALFLGAVLWGLSKLVTLLPEGVALELPVVTGDEVSLGTAAFPAGTPTAGATLHRWAAAQLTPSRYQSAYALAANEGAAIEQALRAYAREVGYEERGGGKFRWAPPAACGDDLRCVFEQLDERSRPALAPLAALFGARARAAGLSSLEAAELVVAFVQTIPYRIPEEQPFGVMPPALVVARNNGDCDSKAMLAHVLLRALGVESMLVNSSAHKHSMLGIALPASGTKFTYAGRSYAFTELTAKGSPIGRINPELLRPNDWRPMPMSSPGARPAPAPAPAPRPKRR